MSWQLYIQQSKRLYNPTPTVSITPDQQGFSYEPVVLTTSDGIKLCGWFVDNGASENVLLFFHGNTGNISDCLPSLEIFRQLGFSTFLFDYRGYGESEGAPDEYGTYIDADTAWRYLVETRGIPADRITVLGRSLGAAIASWLAVRHPPRALIIESTFTSLPDIAAETHPFLPARLLARYRYDVLDNIRQLQCPLLVVHSKDDEVISLAHGHKLFEQARPPKQFLEIEGPHNDGFLTTGQPYIDGLKDFIRKQA